MGRRSSFEVTVNEVVVHSKLKTMAFPDQEQVVAIVKATNEGSDPEKVKSCLGAITLHRFTKKMKNILKKP